MTLGKGGDDKDNPLHFSGEIKDWLTFKTSLRIIDSQHFKSLRRGVLRAFWGLKTENVVFFRTGAFLESTLSFFS